MRVLIEGTNSSETLTGSKDKERLVGRDGADLLLGRKGADILEGGKGQDTLDGGNGSDDIRGQRGSDTILVTSGNDTIDGGKGSDWLDASTWEDGIYWNLNGFTSTDFLTGIEIPAGVLLLASSAPVEEWQQQIITSVENFQGSESRDYINSGSDWGTVRLGKGDDDFLGNKVDLVTGGRGKDFIAIDSGRAEGGRGADRLEGSAREGKALLIGGKGDDTLLVTGATEARGGSGDDLIFVRDGGDTTLLNGGPGADVFEFNGGFGQGVIQDFTPGVDKFDISAYTSRQGDTFDDLQSMFEDRPGGVALVLDLQNFSNQTFVFEGLSRSDLSEDDFILI